MPKKQNTLKYDIKLRSLTTLSFLVVGLVMRKGKDHMLQTSPSYKEIYPFISTKLNPTGLAVQALHRWCLKGNYLLYKCT